MTNSDNGQEQCEYYGQAVPPDHTQCSNCIIVNECYLEWKKSVDEIGHNVLDGLISYYEAKQKLAELGVA